MYWREGEWKWEKEKGEEGPEAVHHGRCLAVVERRGRPVTVIECRAVSRCGGSVV